MNYRRHSPTHRHSECSFIITETCGLLVGPIIGHEGTGLCSNDMIMSEMDTTFAAASSAPLNWSSSVTFFVNGEKKVERPRSIHTTVLQYVRSSCGLTGTKLGCGEGGCGACTVMVSSIDSVSGKVHHFAVNACLLPLCSVDGCAITTVEGIGGMRQGLHPVQQRISAQHGSQCGFCTPGIVMAVYALLRSNPKITAHELEANLDGNLCRCTGYRPILDAAKSLATKSMNGCCKSANGCAESDCCSKRTECGEGGCSGGGGCDRKLSLPASSGPTIYNSTELTIESLMSLEDLNISEPIFPPFLHTYKRRAVKLEDDAGHLWFQPTDLQTLLALKAEHANSRIIVGNTEIGIEAKFKGSVFPVLINPSHVAELRTIVEAKHASIEGISIGAAVTINQLQTYLTKVLEDKSNKWKHRGLAAVRDMLTWFASNQIRNVASIGGNIVTASPIADLNPVLMACGAVLTIASQSSSGTVRHVNVDNFFLNYRQVAMQQEDVLVSVFVPYTVQHEFVVPLKQARRREDDISIVTAGVRVELEPSHTDNCWKINNFQASFGGLAPTTRLSTTASLAVGSAWDQSSIYKVCEAARGEFSLSEDTPGGQHAYRMSLASSFMYKAYLSVNAELKRICHEHNAVTTNGHQLPSPPHVDENEQSGVLDFITSEKCESRGEQTYVAHTDGLVTANPLPMEAVVKDENNSSTIRTEVGKANRHASGDLHASGEAEYTADIPLPSNALHGALVCSPHAHARIVSVDTTEAEAVDGFVRFFSAKDVTGKNLWGPIESDEEVFASEEVLFVGAVRTLS
jgi:xanthine dehydrogenase/oxidase